jgi:hypothetical protein
MKIPSLCFFLLADWAKHNRNINYNSPKIKELVDLFQQNHIEIGIHPGIHTYNNADLIKKEKKRLTNLLGKPVSKSRQHYLRFVLPETYNLLIENGITEDYSMGYVDAFGFRAGTSLPFYFFNVATNKAEDLKINPIAFMEVSFAEELKMTPEESLPKILQLIEEVKKVNGHFSCLWHNHTLSNSAFWAGWLAVHDAVVEKLQAE